MITEGACGFIPSYPLEAWLMTGKIMPPLLLDVVVVFAKVTMSPNFSSITSWLGEPYSFGFTKL
jgi:hypothetical protein